MKRVVPVVVLFFVFVCSSEAAVAAEAAPPQDGYASSAPADKDPWEPFNRKVFWFNEHLDRYVVEPTARGWNLVVPKRVQTSVSNFFANLRFPVDTVNNLLQGKIQPAATDVGRFVVNTTIGIAGFFDPATSLGMEPHVEDFGQTLAVWGVPSGPYLVLPILGPSTVRDGTGLAVDAPISITWFFVDWYYLLGARAVELVNFRASILDAIRQARQASLDYYVFTRSAYLQRREAAIADQGATSKTNAEDLYYPETE